jgi:hypothetical protein
VVNPYSELFTSKYFAVTAGTMIILGMLMYKKNLYSKLVRNFKYATVLNLWIFLMYVLYSEVWKIMDQLLQGSGFSADYIILATMIIVSYMLAYSIPRVKLLYDGIMGWISLGLYTIALLAVFISNVVSPGELNLNSATLAVNVIGTVELAFVTLISILALRAVTKGVMTELKNGLEWYPLVLSLYFVVVLTQILVCQYNISINNLIIGILYLLTALCWITFGFVKRYVFVRRFGLGLSVLSVAKLFLLDLSFLTEGYRIISYFVFGVTLLAISFVYQYFTKKIDESGEVASNEKKAEH